MLSMESYGRIAPIVHILFPVLEKRMCSSFSGPSLPEDTRKYCRRRRG